MYDEQYWSFRAACLLCFFQRVNKQFKPAGVMFASAWIGDAVLERLELNCVDAVREWILSVAGQPAAGSLAGHLFERYAHRFLCSGGVFPMRELLPSGAGAGSQFTLARMTRIDFHLTAALKLTVGQYAVPTISNLAAGDSLCLRSPTQLVIFQSTVSKEHPLVLHGVNTLVKACPGVTDVQIIFVVPNKIFDVWKQPQKYVTKSKGTPCKNPTFAAPTSQYVLCVNLALPATKP
jgi:hypothetical protein